MCIFSNKFDLKQTIRVLHTGGQQFWRTPLRDQVWQEVNKQYHGLTTLKATKENRYYDITFWKKQRSAKVQRRMASYRNKNLCFYCKRFNHQQEDCRTRIQDGQPCTDNRGRKYWPKRYTDENDTQGQGPTSPISALKSYVTPLLGSRSVLTQIILNLCPVSYTHLTLPTNREV